MLHCVVMCLAFVLDMNVYKSIKHRMRMLDAKTMLLSNVLDLALTYLGILVVLVVVHPVLNQRLLALR